MTRAEAIKIMEQRECCRECVVSRDFTCKDCDTAFEMAIKALEQIEKIKNMTREEAIKMLKSKMDGNTDTSYEWAETVRMAIKALERTEPQEVLYEGDGYADGEMVYDFAECPKCGYEYEESDHIWGLPFCPKCGQALKWEVEYDQR